MKSLKLLDRCRESWKHTQKPWEKLVLDGWMGLKKDITVCQRKDHRFTAFFTATPPEAAKWHTPRWLSISFGTKKKLVSLNLKLASVPNLWVWHFDWKFFIWVSFGCVSRFPLRALLFRKHRKRVQLEQPLTSNHCRHPDRVGYLSLHLSCSYTPSNSNTVQTRALPSLTDRLLLNATPVLLLWAVFYSFVVTNSRLKRAFSPRHQLCHPFTIWSNKIIWKTRSEWRV